ncbi:bifunctional DedA family/phosphatase PAP2 family protein [Thiohalomonas denitrificans]|uniref:Undecaprenyl-diphosphatase n=1 Tax=Thiohalomonas denitrificans TaxID=415747 RepID=A0A1G5Q7J3_9GAMM|nr:bifunctional DedA family/phosphatase PAP2 family protein [Thiohalomonas denitrificans]SCZ57637.1 undecaprenyl-diphosphatase [Thiohalomonas denitrificans]
MELIAPLLAWIETHSTWAGVLVFLIAFSESLAVVGLFLPGAMLMFGIGALVGSGSLEFWPTLAWAAAGAIAGDGVSFWLGRYFHEGLKTQWPFRTHPEFIENATGFFQRHGGKSILLGRFIGPIRPIIPAVAGMMDMPVGRFFAVNVVSGILWAPAYVLPGVVFAATLGLAAEVAMRLAALIVLLLTLLLFTFWVAKHTFRWLHPKAHAMIAALLGWSQRHPYAGRLPTALLDPHHPEGKALTLLAFLLLGAVAGFVTLFPFSGEEGWFPNLDSYVFHSLQELRTPVMDRLMVATTELGDGRVLVPLFMVVLAWLLLRGRISAAAHWAAVGTFTLVANYGLKAFTALQRPTEIYQGVFGYSFPSGHALSSTALLGFLSVLIGRELPERSRWLAYAVAALLVIPIAFSRLYLGVHWLTDVLGGLTLGLAWVALVGIAYRRHPAGHLSPGALGIVALGALAIAGTWNIASHHREDLILYAKTPDTQQIAFTDWQSGAWRQLPAFRAELRGVRRHPLTLQYAGDLQNLRDRLQSVGWQPPTPLTGLSWLRWLSDVPLGSVPVLPQVHKGLNESLLLIRNGGAECPLKALRLWPSHVSLEPRGLPLWEGNVSCLMETSIPAITVPVTGTRFGAPLEELAGTLDQLELPFRTVNREITAKDWKGHVLLIRSP